MLTGASSSAAPGTFLRLLRTGADSKDYASFVAHLRELGPAAIDRELRAMQVCCRGGRAEGGRGAVGGRGLCVDGRAGFCSEQSVHRPRPR
jgi:hypothetical protein